MKGKLLGLLVAVGLLLLLSSAWADPDVSESGPFVTITGIDGDFTYTYSSLLYGPYGRGARIDWIWLIDTTSAGVYVKIDEGTASGPALFYSYVCENFMTEPVYYHGTRLRPVLDYSESSVGHDTTTVIIKLWPEQ